MLLTDAPSQQTDDLSFRNEQFQGRKIIAQVPAVAGKQPVCVDLGVRADQEISDNAALSANTLHIGSKDFAGKQRALAGGRHEPELPITQEFVDLPGGCEGRTNFRPARTRKLSARPPQWLCAAPVLKNQRARPN